MTKKINDNSIIKKFISLFLNLKISMMYFWHLAYQSKNCTLVEMILQSLPQIALKCYNNFLIRQWSTIGILSISFSAFSAVCSIIMALRVFDKETKVLNKSYTNVLEMSTNRSKNRAHDNCFSPVDI